MELKFCSSCGQENVLTAKYCMGCRFEFPNLEIAKQKKPLPKVIKKDLNEEDYSGAAFLGENVDKQIESEVHLANIFLNQIEAQGLLDKPKPIKIEDAIGTSSSKSDRSNRAKAPSVSAVELLKSTESKYNIKS